MNRLRAELLAPWMQAAATIAFAAFVIVHGVPALRHDWSFPLTSNGTAPYFLDAVSTWHDGGLGEPALYPNQYLYFGALYVLSRVLPPTILLGLVSICGALLCVVAARLFADAKIRPWTASAVTLILLFNPWVYNELVAGHITMLLSYGATLVFIASALSLRPQRILMCVAVVIAAQQLQFFTIILFATAVWWRARGDWAPFAVGAITALPVCVGILFGYSGLMQVPYTLTWQHSQSVVPIKALALTGYYANYDSVLQPLSRWAALALALVAATATIACWRQKRVQTAAIATVVFIVVISGTNGPLAHQYEFIVEHVKASGLFRELYDLVAYIVAGYIVLALSLTRRFRGVSVGLFVIGAAMLITWCFAPPSRYWVPGEFLPQANVSAQPDSRFAVMPAFQPLAFEHRGSGADPDLYERAGNVEPLNEYIPTYPAVTALAVYQQRGDSSLLSGLSVSQIVHRAGFCSDVSTLAGQLSSSLASVTLCGHADATTNIRAIPEVTVQHTFAIGSLTNNIGAGNLLASDAAQAGIIPPVSYGVPRPSNDNIDARQGWVDARLAFLTDPEIGQPYGGVYTDSAPSLLPITKPYILASVQGRLEDAASKTRVSASTRGFAWIRVPTRVRFVRCVGHCAVALENEQAWPYPVNPKPENAATVPFSEITPWLRSATLPPVPQGGMVRLNVAYSRWWRIVGVGSPRRTLVHARVDGVVNGWIATAPLSGGRVLFVEVRSLLLQACELISVLVLAALFAILAKSPRSNGLGS